MDITDAVASVLREVSLEVVEPRFASTDGDSWAKSPGEIVTEADLLAEKAIAIRLNALLPGVPVIGEESVDLDPHLLSALGAPRSWLVDPIDGTANFAARSSNWAMMISLQEAGVTVLSWIWQPMTPAMYVAELGSGVTRNERPLRLSDRPDAPLRGAVYLRFLDDVARSAVNERAHALDCEVLRGHGSAGVEYPLVATGGQDFVVVWRTLPWDHAPGSLVVSEAGGKVARPDGRPYVLDDGRFGLVAAVDESTWSAAASLLGPQSLGAP
ncbi:MAG TPA: inositol monophosphatase family protein [Acidimicrobiales bacterium]